MVTRAIIIPGDEAPRESTIKRQLLFFDHVLLPLPDDAALLNPNEISELFPDGYTLKWGEIGPYPRSASYVEAYQLLRGQSEPATRGKLRFVSVRARSPSEATNNWVASVAALGNESLAHAALPDFSADSAPPRMGSEAGYNMMVPSRTGFESQYHWLTKLEATSPLVLDEPWRRVAMGRLGRTMKIVRRAAVEGAIPLAIDSPNRNICLALGAQAYGDLPTPQQLASAAVALDTVDPLVLDTALSSMSWAEVMRIRKEILPAVSKLRGLLVASVRAAAQSQNSSIEPYLAALSQLKDEYRAAQDEVSLSWKKIGLRVVEATAATGLTGLATLAPHPHWAAVFTGFALATAAKAISGTTPDVASIVRAGKHQRASPLFAFDSLVGIGESMLANHPMAKSRPPTNR
jgi:hypothetical protein